MAKRRITEKQMLGYKAYLHNQEKSPATIEKYIRDVGKFQRYLQGDGITREQLLAYKRHLTGIYQAVSVNSMLAALNSFLAWQGLEVWKVKPLKIQRQIFRPQEKELTKKDYHKLLSTAKNRNDIQLNLIMQTICATGIRISELAFITAETLNDGYIQVRCKNKTRFIWVPGMLQKQLKIYAAQNKIISGPIFITKNGNAVGRGFVWKKMKQTAKAAGIDPGKVYPHNLRHLFASTFYQINKDIVKLSDLLGHSSIETTRIYTMTSGKEHAVHIEKLGLVSGNT